MRSLGLLVVAFIALATVEGCGSDDSGQKKTNTLSTAGTAGVSGTAGATSGSGGSAASGCMAAFCPAPAGVTACCVNTMQCGHMSTSGSCVPNSSSPDAGAH